jgi:hypothetical protein
MRLRKRSFVVSFTRALRAMFGPRRASRGLGELG